MSDFLLDASERAVQAEVRELFARELGQRATVIEADADWNTLREAVTITGSAGFLGHLVPQALGLDDTPSLVRATIVAEEAARWCYAFESTIASSLSCAVPIASQASDAIARRWLEPLARGQAIGAICITEPEVGSDSAGMATRMTRDPSSGDYRIDGFKRYISNAGVADIYLVYGITNPNVAAQRGMTALVVPADAEGLTFPRQYTLMGRRGCVVGEMQLEGVVVSEEHRLGQEDHGFRVMLGMFNLERVLLGGAGLGVARTALDIARDHAQRRTSFGQKLGCKQLIWSTIADMSWRIDAAELLTYRAARLYDQGLRGKQLMKQAAMAKLVATETAVYCADRTVQILGGDGVTKEYGRAEQLYRDARALPIVGGSSEMARYVIASSELPDLKPNL